MKYQYSAAWAVVGGIALSEDREPIELVSRDRYRFSLTRRPDQQLEKVDRGSAIARLMLKGLVGQRGRETFPEALAAELDEIKAERQKKAGAQAVLLYEAEGEIDLKLEERFHEHDDFILAFDLVDKPTMRRLHQNRVEAMKTAVAFQSETPSRFTELGDGTYLIGENGKGIFSVSFSMNGEGSLSTALSDANAKIISGRYEALLGWDDLASVERLFAQMAEQGVDKLKAFLSGWAALEILVAKSFKRYEVAFLSPFTQAGQPTLRERFLGRIKDVMKDKYRLTDKFIAVTAVLFPQATDDEVKGDYDRFCELKALRDSIFHGDPFTEKDLPVHELARLLRKYALGHLVAARAVS